MKKHPKHLMPLVLFALITAFTLNRAALAQSNGEGAAPPKPPMAEKKTKTTKIHGETLVDDYFWLREKSNPAVISYLESENAHTEAVMKPSAAFQEKLYKEMVGHIKETDSSVPYRWGNYFYYTRTEQGKQYPSRDQAFLGRKRLLAPTTVRPFIAGASVVISR